MQNASRPELEVEGQISECRIRLIKNRKTQQRGLNVIQRNPSILHFAF